jgi:hypothetical protein
VSKLTVAISVLFALLATPAVAQVPLAPNAMQIRASQDVAMAYWHTLVPCGSVAVIIGATPVGDDATAQASTCRITLSDAVDWRDFPLALCRVYVHEMGHLILGPDYFATSDPSDPGHSVDPSNIMFHSPTLAQEERLQRVVGCTATLGVSRSVKHVHKGRRSRRARK